MDSVSRDDYRVRCCDDGEGAAGNWVIQLLWGTVASLVSEYTNGVVLSQATHRRTSAFGTLHSPATPEHTNMAVCEGADIREKSGNRLTSW